MVVVTVLGALLVGYLLGSIPFGLLVTRLGGAGDVRAIGSGNIGATNVLRTGRKGLAAATLLLDALKGALAVVAGVMLWWLLLADPMLMGAARAAAGGWGPVVGGAAAVGAMVGHCFPVWLDFKGGKGVATFLGTTLALFWPGGVAFALVWLSTAYLTRYSSLSALVAVGSAPVIALLLGGVATALVLLIMAGVVFYRHGDNIRRLRSGTEPRIGSAA